MSDNAPSSGSGGAKRRRLSVAIAVVAVAVVGVALVVIAPWSGGSPSADSAPGTAPRFVDVTAQAGLDHVYDGEFEYFVGGGVAALDCDDDGRTDLYFAGGSEPAALYRNHSEAGSVQMVREESPVTDVSAVTGAYPLDVDSDGRTDLIVLRRGENRILLGEGDCSFEEADDLGLDGGDDWTVAFSATWEGDNTLPTLVFGNYLTLDRERCADSELIRPDDSGERYAAPIALTPGDCTLSVLLSDWSRSGRTDLRMTNDRHYYRDGSEQLWEIAEGQPPRLYGEDEGWRPIQIWGMGIASQDVTGDGVPEVFLTSQGDNKLQALEDGTDQPHYGDIALRLGATAQRPYAGGDVLPSTAWHPEFDDVNNDGLVDLFVTKGNVEAQPDYASRDPNNLLLGQPDGTFVEGGEAAGIVEFERSRGAVVTDVDLDGLLDIVVVNRRTSPTVWHNLGEGTDGESDPMGNWIEVRLRQDAPNVDAVGAWIEVRTGEVTTTRELTVGGGHAGGESSWLHVGLGADDEAEVRVQWPDGEVGPWMPVDANRRVVIERGADEPQSVTDDDR